LLIVVGNKLDLKEEKKVSDEAIREKFTELGIKHFEVSAKTGENI
jgi:putative ribosome biogenesis GTPase RsgA